MSGDPARPAPDPTSPDPVSVNISVQADISVKANIDGAEIIGPDRVSTGPVDLDPLALNPVALNAMAFDPVVVAGMVATAVLRCPDVVELHQGGGYRQIVTYLPGRRIEGVQVSPAGIEVGVVGRYPATVTDIAAQVRAAVAAIAPGVPVAVSVEDLAVPGDPRLASTAPSGSGSPLGNSGNSGDAVSLAGAGGRSPVPDVTPPPAPAAGPPLSADPLVPERASLASAPSSAPSAPPEQERPS